MAQPSNATVTIDGVKYQALTAHVEFATHHDDIGLPMMDSLRCGVSAAINLHDTDIAPFTDLSKLYDLAILTTRDKIKDIKIEFGWMMGKRTQFVPTPFAAGSASSVRVVVGAPTTPSA